MSTLESPIAWCRSVIRNAAISEIRTIRRYADHESLTLNQAREDGSEPVDAIPSAAAAVAFSEADVRLILLSLPWFEQDVLRLLYLSELTQQEVARQLGIPQQQVSRVHRHALSTLRQQLSSKGE